jgi:hypothetical protein
LIAFFAIDSRSINNSYNSDMVREVNMLNLPAALEI